MPAWAKTEGGPLTMRQIDALVDGIEKNWAKPNQFSDAKLPPYVADQQGIRIPGKSSFCGTALCAMGREQKLARSLIRRIYLW